MRARIKRVLERTVERINDLKIKKKLHLVYILCMLLPLIITDSVVLYMVIHAETVSRQYELQNIAEAVKYSLTNEMDAAAISARNIYVNKYIDEFMEAQYSSSLDYYNNYLKQMQDSLFKSSIGTSTFKITMYADNDTIINGGEFARLDTVRDTKWYQYFKNAEQDVALYLYYEESRVPCRAKRKVSLIRKLNYYQFEGREKILKMDMDYSSLVRDLVKMNYEVPIYICLDGKIIFSNNGHAQAGNRFDDFEEWARIDYQENFNLYSQNLDIYILQRDPNMKEVLRQNSLLIILLVCINAFLPWLFVRIINQSFTERLQKLSLAFDSGEEEELKELDEVRGQDEIGALMRNYNRMAGRINELIQTVFKEELKKQEIDIARQKAELLALHSQINPHFLFNALESIRMHSVLKGELETAEMVERLAKMERQYVDWGADQKSVRDELCFVEAYLELQKYRFGERLNYRIEAAASCLDFQLPKLTLLTFVENACVHGMENKSTKGWIFVRVYREEENLILEIEDTGNGMREEELMILRAKMEHADIRDLQGKGRVGIINACIRLKMVTDNQVSFMLESEVGIGTTVAVQIPWPDDGVEG